MYHLRVTGRFCAAHHLPDYDGKCANVHGHTWEVAVRVRGPVLDHGMLMDFGDLKRALKHVLDRWDHRDLNEFFSMPTAECLAGTIAARFARHLHSDVVELRSVSVKEGPNSEAIFYLGDD